MQSIYDLFAQQISHTIGNISKNESFVLLFKNSDDNDRMNIDKKEDMNNDGVAGTSRHALTPQERAPTKQAQQQKYEQTYGEWIRSMVMIYQEAIQKEDYTAYHQRLIQHFRRCWEWLLDQYYITVCYCNDKYRSSDDQSIPQKRKLDNPLQGLPPNKKQFCFKL
ncbi:hypothetical protein RFI_08282 [Reticulomyxa filosa]|uniref:Uncharacterized protein n=1 Tax=Reticulomyxa filosa TaxID=46433 RepID=X6NUA0_RETFI|nr:hypothetical protein RFI_08282 [Reticulomyxa filosa]|eukprot:ETO28842.1 hypothetical protein RFI_08282 [Reticulomyxa filosa]